MPRVILYLWLLASFGDFLAAGLLSYGFVQHRREWSRLDICWTVALGAISLESLCTLISLFLPQTENVVAYTLFRLIGRSIKAIALWIVVIESFGKRRRHG